MAYLPIQGSGGGSEADQETLKHLKYNPVTNQIESDREIQTTLNSFFLGDQHKMSSGAENIFFTNLNSKINFFPAWSGLKDHRIVGNRGAGGVITPSIRKYADMQTLEPYGAAAASGSVAYNKAAALLGNHSVLGQTFIVMEPVAEDDWLEYQVWYGTDETGIQAYEQKFTGQSYEIGDTVDWWFTHPIEGFAGTPIVTCIKLRKGGEDGEAHYLQVRPSASNAANHYSAVRLRVFNDEPIHVPRVGDIKESFQTSDHEGWVILDGRLSSTLPETQQTIASTFGWLTNIPSALSRVSVGASESYPLSTSGGSSKIGRASLPNVGLTFSGTSAANNRGHTHQIDPPSTTTGNQSAGHTHPIPILDGRAILEDAVPSNRKVPTTTGSFQNDICTNLSGSSRQVPFTEIDETLDQSNLPHGHAVKTEASTTGANSANHTHTVNIAEFTSAAESQNHTHTYSGTTASMNGNTTQADHMVPYLAVNKFVYLGY